MNLLDKKERKLKTCLAEKRRFQMKNNKKRKFPNAPDIKEEKNIREEDPNLVRVAQTAKSPTPKI